MTTNNIIATDLQSTEVGSGLVELYELYLEEGQDPICFHPGLDNNYNEIKFYSYQDNSKINTYYALPIILKGVDQSSDGPIGRPTLTVGNVEPIFQYTLSQTTGTYFEFEDLIGTTVIVRQTLEKYLIGGSDPNKIEFPVKKYIIDRVSVETSSQVAFELAAVFDLSNIQVPSRIIIGKFCSWIYQGKEEKNISGCPWSTDNTIKYGQGEYQIYFNLNDEPLVNKKVFDGLASTYSSTKSYPEDAYVVYNGRYFRSEGGTNLGNIPTSSLLWQEVRVWEDWLRTDQQTVEKTVSLVSTLGDTTINLTNTTNLSVGMTVLTTSKVSGTIVDVVDSNTIIVSGGVEVPVLSIGTTLSFASSSDSASFSVNSQDPNRSSYVRHENKIWRVLISHTFDTSKTPGKNSIYWKRVDYCGKTLKSCKSRFQATISNGLPSSSKNTAIQLPFGAFPGSVKFK
jgi:lambda family phage minor tail protein L